MSAITRELLASESFARAELESLRVEKLRSVMAIAWKQFPFHRERFEAAGLDPASASSIDVLRHLPFLEKHELPRLRAETEARSESKGAVARMTAGSSGDPAVVLADARANAFTLAARRRFFAAHGLRDGDRELRLWGRPITTARRKTLLKTWILNRVLVDADQMNAENRAALLARLDRFRPDYLYGYTSLVAIFSAMPGVEDLRAKGWTPKAAICTSEASTRFERDEIGEGLGCPVLNEYGCSETDIIAAQCPEGRLHVLEDRVIVEIVDAQGQPAESGEILVTDLDNHLMPMIRYRIGDTATVSSEGCPCGRPWMVLESLDGRVQGQLLTAPDGTRFHTQTLAYLFEDLVHRGVPVRRFKAVQTEPARLVLKIVTDVADEAGRASIVERVVTESNALTGNRFTVDVEFVSLEDVVPRTGKYRHFESLV